MAKSYNPFKMILPYIFAGYAIIANFLQWFDMLDILLWLSVNIRGYGFNISSVTGGIITSVVLSFLIGWAIQSLYRRFA